jgi:hypothetical protein
MMGEASSLWIGGRAVDQQECAWVGSGDGTKTEVRSGSRESGAVAGGGVP